MDAHLLLGEYTPNYTLRSACQVLQTRHLRKGYLPDPSAKRTDLKFTTDKDYRILDLINLFCGIYGNISSEDVSHDLVGYLVGTISESGIFGKDGITTHDVAMSFEMCAAAAVLGSQDQSSSESEGPA